MTIEEFIKRAKSIHGDKYDYSKAEYISYSTKLCIVCPEHGEFWQRPNDHLKGHGCRKCANKALSKLRNKGAYFINRAKRVHGERYDYSKSEYRNNRTKISIICPTHGAFLQTPTNHLAGAGCPHCANESKGKERIKPFNQFVSEAYKVHGHKYIYIEETYKNERTKMKIICPVHDAFYQTPKGHLRGHGCPHCRESHGEREISIWLQKHNLDYKREYQIIPEQTLFGRNKFFIDFYLPKHKVFIEYHGEQHFKRAENWQTEDDFVEQQDRDRRLREYCKSKGIKLIEIPYTKLRQIGTILKKQIYI